MDPRKIFVGAVLVVMIGAGLAWETWRGRETSPLGNAEIKTDLNVLEQTM